MKKRVLSLIVALLASITYLSAYDFEVDGIYYNKEGDREVSVTRGDEPYSGDVLIPSTVEYEGEEYSVVCIGAKTFMNNMNISSVVLSEGITDIRESAFYWSSIKTIVLPSSIVNIGEYAFCGCVNITSINLPEGVKSIGNGAFGACSKITSVILPNSITSIQFL